MKGDNPHAKTVAIKQMIVASVMLFIQILVFFICAGQIDIRPWILFGTSFLHYFVSTAVQYKLNPELLAARLKVKREGSKLWDEILMRMSNLTVLIAIPAVAGFDVGKYHWSTIDVWSVIPGLALLAVSTILLNWAMAVNPHFEPTVRIQKDRHHKVITDGPYGLVRHPGYLAGILFVLFIPLIVGSIFTFIPVGIYIFLVIIRTILEDKTLQRELDGYSEYAEKVKRRLFPWLW